VNNQKNIFYFFGCSAISTLSCQNIILIFALEVTCGAFSPPDLMITNSMEIILGEYSNLVRI